MLTIAAIVLTSVTLGAQTYEIGGINSRDALLVTPPPYPANHVDSPDRLENGRLWYPRTFTRDHSPMREARYGGHSAMRYGAHPHANHQLIYTRVGHQVIAISPWAMHEQNHSSDASPKYRLAANQWLSENGYVLRVRTHVNSRYVEQHMPSRNARMEHMSLNSSDDSGTRYGPDGLPLPRATIKIDRVVRPKIEPRASRDAATIRIVKPAIAAVAGPAIAYTADLVEHDVDATPATASAHEAQDTAAALSLVDDDADTQLTDF